MTKRPPWRQQGHEPDYRFSMANERTFLAWVRTALALLAGSVAIDQFTTAVHHAWIRTSIATALAVAGFVLATFAYVRWRGNESAMRNDRPLPHSPILMSVAVLVAGMAAVVLAVVAGHARPT